MLLLMTALRLGKAESTFQLQILWESKSAHLKHLYFSRVHPGPTSVSLPKPESKVFKTLLRLPRHIYYFHKALGTLKQSLYRT